MVDLVDKVEVIESELRREKCQLLTGGRPGNRVNLVSLQIKGNEMNEETDKGSYRIVTMGGLLEALGVSRQTIYNWMAEGLPVWQESKDLLFDLGAVEKFIEAREKRG